MGSTFAATFSVECRTCVVATWEKGSNLEWESVHVSHPVGPIACDAMTIDSTSGCEMSDDTYPTVPRGGPLNLDASGLVKGRVGVPSPNDKVWEVSDKPHGCDDMSLTGTRNGR